MTWRFYDVEHQHKARSLGRGRLTLFWSIAFGLVWWLLRQISQSASRNSRHHLVVLSAFPARSRVELITTFRTIGAFRRVGSCRGQPSISLPAPSIIRGRHDKQNVRRPRPVRNNQVSLVGEIEMIKLLLGNTPAP